MIVNRAKEDLTKEETIRDVNVINERIDSLLSSLESLTSTVDALSTSIDDLLARIETLESKVTGISSESYYVCNDDVTYNSANSIKIKIENGVIKSIL
jgi:predicted RNase H-like nuclease (RuvC/YqgF family)